MKQSAAASIVALCGLFLAASLPARAQDDRISQVKREARQFAQLQEAGQIAEAEQYILGVITKYRQAGDPQLEFLLTVNLADFYTQQGRYPEGVPLAEQAYRGCNEHWGPKHAMTGSALKCLGRAYSKLNRLDEAIALYRRAREIAVAQHGVDHENVLAIDADIASDLAHLGRFHEAEPIHQKVLAWERRHSHGRPSRGVAIALHNLANLYYKQARHPEAEKLLLEASEVYVQLGEGTSVLRARSLDLLADTCESMQRHADAEAYLKQSHAIYVRVLGPDHPLAALQNDLADVYVSMNRLDEAEPLLRQALAFAEKYYGPDSSHAYDIQAQLAMLYLRQQKFAEADQLSLRMLQLAERPGFPPATLYKAFERRSLILWYADKREEACQLASRAIELEEQLRSGLSGGEQEMTQSAAQAHFAYDHAAECYLLTDRPVEAFSFCERGRGRMLLDQMSLGNVDLFAGMESDRAEQLRAAFEQLKNKTADLESRIAAVESRGDLPAESKARELASLDAELKQSRRDQTEAYAFIRNESPAFRRVVGQHFAGVSVADLQRYLKQNKAALLYYLVTVTESYLLAFDGDEGIGVYPLRIGDDEARQLGLEPKTGLSRGVLNNILLNDRGSGILQLVSRPDSGSAHVAQLAALRRVVLGDAVLKQLLAGGYQQVIIVPDGPLAMLPFEALVVEEGAEPKYLLDVAPPISYAPSATVLVTLAERPELPLPADRDPVLALGDPAYAQRVATAADVDGQFRSRGGQLTQLPYSGLEATWVAEIFSKHGMKAGVLRGRDATEAAVRAHAPQRRILHLACHGLADEETGNFFGALALSPGSAGRPTSRDDGILMMNEIYDLDLRACELSILSACQTNYGPQHAGEGIWALSRAFLVAGSRRVVASNWLIDDKAGASLISYFCGNLASPPTGMRDYALALRGAKRWTRGQRPWSHPYYWATFVLIGPP